MPECGICQVEHTIAVPCVHSNGTAAVDLLEPIIKSIESLQSLDYELKGTFPNERDYYLVGNGQQAIKEHCLRREKLMEIAAELVQMRDHVQAVIYFKNAFKR